jgi:glucose 1-dehydrogenase
METRTSTLDTTERQFDMVIAVDLKSAFFGVQLAAKQMIAQGGGGRIINISSIHEDWPMPGNSPYCAAKGGVRMLTRTAGVELAPHGITSSASPQAPSTPRIDDVTLSDPVAKARLESAIPLGRARSRGDRPDRGVPGLGQASYGTATTYTVDGGMMQASVGL